mmetsp:Transcript_57187/g.90653  ORF Transcript_57187/g.90653 Transcript_57187/m.90653 type:complete len:597 (+) Transcript_57187:66-1856(+)
MGNKGPVPVKKQLQRARSRAEEHVGKVAVTGRYHLLPRKLEDDFEVTSQVLGTGLNGSVLLARSRQTGNEVAVKPYTSVGINKEEQRVLRNEVEIFLSLDHPHVARLIAVYEEQDRLLLVMEVCKGGEILSSVARLGHFSEARAADLVEQMLLSVNYLHSKKIVHRDLKLDNFLFESEERDHVKLIDFGMSRYWTNNKKMKLACGTAGYMAPECLHGSYTIQCDMWSMGVIAYILLSGRMPFEGSEEQMMIKTKSGDYSMTSNEWHGISADGKDFVSKLMEKDVAGRLSAEEALQHRWIADRRTPSKSQEIDDSIVKSLRSFAEISEFRRTCLQLMSYSLSLEERKKVRDAFLQIDHQKTGRIKMNELSRVLGEHVSDNEARSIFNSLDSNSDEHINYTDFLAAMLTSRIVQNEGHMRAAFNRFDKDGTGVISLENLREVLGDTHQGQEIEELFREIDVAKDGVISYDEFMAYLQDDDPNEAHQEAICKVIDAEIQKSPLAGPCAFKTSLHSISQTQSRSGITASSSDKPLLNSQPTPQKQVQALTTTQPPLEESMKETVAKGSMDDEKAPLNTNMRENDGTKASVTTTSCACNLL